MFRLDRERIAKQVIWQSRLVLDVRRHDPLVAFREHLGHPSPERGVLSAREGEGGGARAERVRGSDRYDRLRQALGDVPHHTLVAGPFHVSHASNVAFDNHEIIRGGKLTNPLVPCSVSFPVPVKSLPSGMPFV